MEKRKWQLIFATENGANSILLTALTKAITPTLAESFRVDRSIFPTAIPQTDYQHNRQIGKFWNIKQKRIASDIMFIPEINEVNEYTVHVSANWYD
jgi:hypothetical protein